jgi:hypothetical protein
LPTEPHSASKPESGRRAPPSANLLSSHGEEDRHAAGGEVREVVDARLPLLGSEARLQRVHVLKRELRDALVGDAPPSGVAIPCAPSNRSKPGIAFASALCVSA